MIDQFDKSVFKHLNVGTQMSDNDGRPKSSSVHLGYIKDIHVNYVTLYDSVREKTYVFKYSADHSDNLKIANVNKMLLAIHIYDGQIMEMYNAVPFGGN